MHLLRLPEKGARSDNRDMLERRRKRRWQFIKIIGECGHKARSLEPTEIKTRDDIAPAITTAATRAQALVTIEDPLIISNSEQIARFALQSKLPMIWFKPQAEAGALMDYGVDLTDNYFHLASFVDKILKGTPPAELPIDRAVKFEVIVNLKTAKAIGIELPTSILLRADEVIE